MNLRIQEQAPITNQELLALSSRDGLTCVIPEEGLEKLGIVQESSSNLLVIDYTANIAAFSRKIALRKRLLRRAKDRATKKRFKSIIARLKAEKTSLEAAKDECAVVAEAARCRRGQSPACPKGGDGGVAGSDLNGCDYTVTGLPLSLRGPTMEAKAAYIEFSNIPSETTTIELNITAFDPDDSDEGRLMINNNFTTVSLFGASARPEYDELYARVSITTPRASYLVGNNRLLFIHDLHAGYTIENLTVRCLNTSGADATPTPAATGVSTRTPTPNTAHTSTPTPTRTATRTPTRTPTPSPTTSGGTPVACNYVINPGESINRYSDTAAPGQTVCIKAGTYRETLRPERSGAPGSFITFRAYSDSSQNHACQGAMGKPKVANSCQVKIDGQTSRESAVDLSGRDYIRVEGFEIYNHAGDGVANNAGWYASAWQPVGNQIVNNYIHDNAGHGVNSDNSDSALIANNEIFRNELIAIKHGGQLSTKNLVARGNNIHYNGVDSFRGGGDNALFEYNVMYDQFHTEAHQDAFDIGKMTNSKIRYNTISDHTQLIYFHDADGGIFENIEIYGNVLYTHRYYTEHNNAVAPGVFITTNVGKNISIHSNTFGWTGLGPIIIDGAIENLKVYNNIIYGNGGSPTVNSQYTLHGNPQFVNYKTPMEDPNFSSWDFRLKAGSPAIDRGPPHLGSLVSLPSPLLDPDQNQRPRGASYEIGAYEYQP